MTDNEIIKALECCSIEHECNGCPAVGIGVFCVNGIIKQAYDLINRQKAEIEKLRKRVNFVEQANVQLREELKETTEKFNCQQYVYADLSDIIRDKNAEIEKLKLITTSNPYCVSIGTANIFTENHEEYEWLLAKISAEAIKEFNARIYAYKTGIFIKGEELIIIPMSDYNEILKEMVGDSK